MTAVVQLCGTSLVTLHCVQIDAVLNYMIDGPRIRAIVIRHNSQE